MLLEGTSTAFSGVVDALGNVLNTEAMFTNLGQLIPVLGGILIFAFTYRIIRKMLRKAPTGKVGI